MNHKSRPFAGFSPEARLILALCLSNGQSGQQLSFSQNEFSTVDWRRLLEISDTNRMIPQVYSRLKQLPSEYLPPGVLTSLQRRFDAISVRNLSLTQELLRILRLLRENNIPAIPYKGPVLSQTLYGNVVSRQFWDLDFLLLKEDILAAKELLIRDGYVVEKILEARDEKRHLEEDCEWSFDRANGQVHLELHWRIFPKHFGLGKDWSGDLWDSSTTAFIAGQTVKSIPPEQLLLLLCVHGGDKHRWISLRWVCDVARLVEVSHELDWDKVLFQAEKYKKEETLFLGLYLVNKLLEVQIPPEILKGFQKYPQIKACAALFRGRYFREDGGLPGFAEWRAYLADMEPSRMGEISRGSRISDFYRYLRALSAPHNTDRAVTKLPHWLAFMYSAYRPFRLLQKHRTKVFFRLR